MATAPKKRPVTRSKTAAPKKRQGAARKSPAARGKAKNLKANVNRMKGLEAARKKKQELAAERAKEQEAQQKEATRQLVPIAKEIDERYSKAHKLDSQADNHRIAAALRLVEAADMCKAAGLVFKTWAAENLHEVDENGKRKALGYEKAKKLLQIGRADDPQAKIEEMRDGARAAMAKTRAKQKKLGKRPAQKDVFIAAEEAVEKVNENGKRSLAEKLAKEAGLRVIENKHYDELATKAKQAEAAEAAKPKTAKERASALDHAKAAFSDLTAPDKLKLLNWAAEQCGYEVKEADLQIPASLDRRPKKKAAPKRKPAAKKAA